MNPATSTSTARAFIARSVKLFAPSLLMAAAVLAPAAHAVTPADQPLATARSAAVKPNIMLLMDTSASMAYTHMPDDLEGVRTVLPVGYASFQCNVLYYNPNQTYQIPIGGNKQPLPTPSFASAYYNYYADFQDATALAANRTNLATSFKTYDGNTTRKRLDSTAQKAYYYVYSGPEVLSYGAQPCTQRDDLPANSASGSTLPTAGGGTWTRIIVSSTEEQNFATWYTYYRTRMALIKSGVSLAFATEEIDLERFRVGLISMNPYALDANDQFVNSTTIDQNKYEPLAPFTAQQRVDWYTRLFAQKPQGSSPAREGLARVGRHYGAKFDSINTGMNVKTGVNPFEYTCQQNFTIMTTDGYWNVAHETKGPVGLDGDTRVGQQDGILTDDEGNVPRPIWDGNTSGTQAVTDQSNEYRLVSCNGGFFYLTTVQSKERSVQYRQRSAQTERNQTRWVESTIQRKESRSQYHLATTQYLKTETQRLKSTFQTLRTDNQFLESTRRYLGGGSSHVETRTTQVKMTINQPQETTQQQQRKTYKLWKSTFQQTQRKYYTTKTTTQYKQLILQRQAQTSQITYKQYQTYKSTTQTQQYSYYNTAVATQHWAYNGQSESTVPIQNLSDPVCSNSNYYCYKLDLVSQNEIAGNFTPQPARVTACTNSTPTSGNGWVTRNCAVVVTVAAATPVQTCAVTTGQPGQNYIYTTCTPNNTTNVLTDTCAAASANSGNQWTGTTCSVTYLQGSVSAGVPIEFCSNVAPNAGNQYKQTACTTTTSNWTNVAFNACTANIPKSSGNQYTSTSCQVVNTANVNQVLATPTTSTTWPTAAAPGTFGFANISSACTTSANFPNTSASTAQICDQTVTSTYRDTSCSATSNITCVNTPVGAADLTTTTPVSSCTVGSSSIDNLTVDAKQVRVFTVCANNNTAEVLVDACSAIAKAPSDYIETRCRTEYVTTTNVVQGAAGCVASAPASPTFIGVECFQNDATKFVSSCTASPGTSSPFIVRSCAYPNNVTDQVVNPASCTGQTGNSGNSWRTVTCTTQTSAWTTTAFTCTASAATSPNWTQTECRTIIDVNPTTPQGTACTQPQIDAGTCTTINTNNIPVQNCTYGLGITGPSAGNNQTWYNCVLDHGAYNGTPVQSTACTNTPKSLANNWKQIVCTQNDTGPTPVINSDCTGNVAEGSGNLWTRTVCSTVNVVTGGVTQVNIPSATCSVSTATAGNGYISTACTNNSTNVPVQSCSLSPATVTTAESITVCTHSPNTTNVPVATCANQVGSAGNGWLDITCTETTTGPNYVASCASVAPVSPNFVETVCVQDTANNYPTPPVGVQTCTPGTDANFVTTVCTDRGTPWAFVAACDFGAGTNPGTSANQWRTTECELFNSNTTFTLVSSCTPQAGNAGNGFRTVECEVKREPDPFAANYVPNVQTGCTPQAAGVGNNYTATECLAVNGQQQQFQGSTTRTVTVLSGTQTVRQTVTPLATQNWSNVGSCQRPDINVATPGIGRPVAGAQPTPAQIYAALPNAATVAPELSGCSEWGQCTQQIAGATGGSENSLADVAQYYYATDLRPPSVGQVTSKRTEKEDDRVTHQHMTTFAVGLGVSGTLNFRDDYRTASTGDFSRIRDKNDAFNWPVWPNDIQNALSYEKAESIDDFWHAAVNGRGQYFSAGKPDTVIAGLSSALNLIQVETGAGSGATTSTLAPVAGDNSAYIANFQTQIWSGELQARNINVTTGALSSTSRWSAGPLLDARVGEACDNRDIYVFRPANANKLAPFAWNTYRCTNGVPGVMIPNTDGLNSTEKAYFTNAALTQFDSMSTSATGAQISAGKTDGWNLVNYLRGQTGKDDYIAGDTNRLFRKRDNVLGSIVGSQPLYVKAPYLQYQDTGYSQFKNDNTTRKSMIYVGANDGMLHAFEDETGDEKWAYIPTMVMSNMFNLADEQYNHKFLVDGSPVSGDVYDDVNNAWKTIVVGGLNFGGRGFYAVDVTTVGKTGGAPKGLWEFKGGTGTTCHASPAAAIGATQDCDLGYSYGRPVITKLGNGKWVVLLTSGYNNTSPGDGKAYLFVLDANTGAIIRKIPAAQNTVVGRGLREINTYVGNIVSSNTAQRVYGGDLDGNVWRFDINDSVAPAGYEATRVGTATAADGTPQPITTRIALAELGGYTMLYFGTGQLLDPDDLNSTTNQSVYGFRDTAINSSADGLTGDVAYADLRNNLKPLKMVANADNTSRTVQCDSENEATCALTLGWRIDLPDTGERVNIDVATALNTLVFTSNVPFGDNACNVGGYSWLNYLSMLTGEAVKPAEDGTAGSVSVRLTQSLNVGLGLIILPTGQVVAITRGSDGVVKNNEVPVTTPGPEGRRVSWREITQ